MNTLRQQVIDALAQAKYPMWPDRIVEHVSATRHASRVRNMLLDLERDGLVKQSSAGWHRTSTEVLIDTNSEQNHKLLERQEKTYEVPDMSSIRDDIKRVLADHPNMTSNELIALLPKHSSGGISGSLMHLFQGGALIRSRDMPYRYRLPDEPAAEPEQDTSEPTETMIEALEPDDTETTSILVDGLEQMTGTIRLLESSAKSARAALETYLDSIDDPVLTHLMNAVNEADQAVDAYSARNPQ